MSIDRGASRYRALSMVASNVANAAALAAQQDGQDGQAGHRRSASAYPSRSGRRHALERSNSLAPRNRGYEEEDYDEDLPTAMADSFRSESARESTSKQVSWSIERHRNRASSVGRHMRPTIPGTLHLSNEPSETANADSMHQEIISPRPGSTDSTNIRSSRASRKGSTMVFLGTWALFGIGTLAGGRRALPSSSMTDIGQILSSHTYVTPSNIPVAFTDDRMHVRESRDGEFYEIHTVLPQSHTDNDNHPEHESHDPEEPSSEQVIGRIFAWLCTTLYLTSRLPQIWKNVCLLYCYVLKVLCVC